MTDAELDELERLEREATKGPWWADDDGAVWKQVSNDDLHIETWLNIETWLTSSLELQTDSDLIAALRNAAPELIRLARERNRYRVALEEISDSFAGGDDAETARRALEGE